MEITNKKDMPQAFVDFLKSKQFGFSENSYSATTIIHSPTEILLARRHDNEIEQDASMMCSTLFGTACHSWLEMFDKTGFAEMKLKTEIKNGKYLSGVCDIYDSVNKKLVDWKTGTVWKYKFKDFRDWKLQALIYTYLLEKENYQVNKVEFWCFMKDWTAKDLRLATLKGDAYPETPIFCYEFQPTDEDRLYIANYIEQWFDELIDLENKADDELPKCSDENTWYTGNKYAVYKLKADGTPYARAEKVFDDEQEAKNFINSASVGKFEIQYRKGEYRKCQDYCNACKWCKHYKEVVNNG